VLYSRATVTHRAAGKSRRWRCAIAIVVALSLFTVIPAGVGGDLDEGAAARAVFWLPVIGAGLGLAGGAAMVFVAAGQGSPERQLLGAALAMILGKGISRPMTAMCKAMRELAGGNFEVVLPGLGRRDELGEMAGAVEEFKMQAIAKAERDAATQDAQNKASSAARRTELIRFADEFETAVGAIVSE